MAFDNIAFLVEYASLSDNDYVYLKNWPLCSYYIEGASSQTMEGNNSRAIPFFSGSNWK